MQTKKDKIRSLKHSLPFIFQAFIAIASMLLLILFLTGLPSKDLLPLWSNTYEVKNFFAYLFFSIALSSVAIFRKKYIYSLAVIIGAFFITAGPAATVWALLTSIAAVVIGLQVAAKDIQKSVNSNIARLTLAFWIGKSFFLLILAILSFFPINNRFIHGCIIIFLITTSSYGLSEARRILCQLGQKFEMEKYSSYSWSLSKFLFLLSAVLLILAAVHPGFDGDAATMHMRVAREMLNKGFWSYDVTEYGYAVMPLAPQLNFSSLFLTGGIEAVKVELTTQLFMTIALVITGGGFRCNPLSVAIGAILILTPMYVREISSLFIEVTLCGFLVAFAVLYTAAIRRRSIMLTLLAATCAAGAMATKTFALLFVPFLFIIFHRNVQSSNFQIKRHNLKFFTMIFGAVTLGSFFYILSWIKTGNPLFPYYNEIFKSSHWAPINFIDNRWINHISWDMPWKMTFYSSLFEESSNGSMGLILALLVISTLSLYTITRKTLIVAIPMLLGTVYLIAVGIQIQYLRYLLPGVLLLTTSLTYFLRSFIRKPNWQLLSITFCSLFIANLFGMPASKFTNGLLHIPFEHRFITKSWRGMPSLNFEEETLNGHQYVAEILNRTARAPQTVLMLGCSYGAYFNGQTIYTNWINYSWTSIEKNLQTSAQFKNYLLTKKVTHIVLDGCTNLDQRVNLIPLVRENSNKIAEWAGVELYKLNYHIL